jgi:hypothetical protein
MLASLSDGMASRGCLALQVASMASTMYSMLSGCQISGTLIAPLVRALALFSMKLDIQPEACTQTTWQAGIREGCFRVAVACLEHLQDAAGMPPGSGPLLLLEFMR